VDYRLIPIIINCRDRVTDLSALVDWLELAGHQRIVLLDNDSTWEPLLDYYARTPHEVVRIGANLGHLALWESGRVPDEWFVYTDPDIIPAETCPPDLVMHLYAAMLGWTGRVKAGPGLKIDDIPAHNLTWDVSDAAERGYWAPEREVAMGLFDAAIDTSFALYRPNSRFALAPALRCGKPYVARHMSWYADTLNPTEEERYYIAHASGSSTWALYLKERGLA
jgi:hypothetical protein